MSDTVNVWKFDVEKLLAIRHAPGDSSGKECLVKFKNLSHRRLVWKEESRLKLDHTGSYYLKRYRSQIYDSNAEAINFCSPNYFMVERILAVRTDDWDCSDESDVECTSGATSIAKKKSDVRNKNNENSLVPTISIDAYENSWDDCTSIPQSNDAGNFPLNSVLKDVETVSKDVLRSRESVERIKRLYDKYSGSKVTRYLVKWRGLGYSYCTWEKQEVVLNDYIPASYYENIRLLNSQLLLRFKQMHAAVCQAVYLQGDANRYNKPFMLLTENHEPSNVHIEGPYCFRMDYISSHMAMVPQKVSNFVPNESLMQQQLSTTVKYTKKRRRIIIYSDKDMDAYYSNCKQLLFSNLQKLDVELVQSGKFDADLTKNRIVIPIDSVTSDDCIGIELKDYQLQGVKWLCK